MAYSLPQLVTPNIFILKLKIHCRRCENKLKRLLMSEVQGIQSVNIDQKQGMVLISGNVDPGTIVTLLGNLGRKAEILWEQRPATDNDKSLQIIPQSKVVDRESNIPDHLVALLNQLSRIKGLKGVNYFKIGMTLNGDQNGSGEKNLEITIRDGVLHSPQVTHSGGLCPASASCCGGHCAVNRNLHGSRGVHAMGYPNWATNDYGFVPPGPAPPWSTGYSPSAPPLGLHYDQPRVSSGESGYPPPPPPPVTGYSFSSFLSDDSPAGSCTVM